MTLKPKHIILDNFELHYITIPTFITILATIGTNVKKKTIQKIESKFILSCGELTI